MFKVGDTVRITGMDSDFDGYVYVVGEIAPHKGVTHYIEEPRRMSLNVALGVSVAAKHLELVKEG